MKLYYIPGACSLASHIVLHELALPHEVVKVDAKTKTFGEGESYLTVNPKGYVPALGLDDGSVLTENPAILQYLADLKPKSGLAPANGSMDRYRQQECLGYLNSEVHKAFSPLFHPDLDEKARQKTIEQLAKKLDGLEHGLGDLEYLVGTQFSISDAYLFVMLGWTGHVGLDLARWPNLKAFSERIGARPSVQAAQAME